MSDLSDNSLNATEQAMIRDLKEYIKHNSPRPILVGGSLTKFASHPMTNASMASLVDYLSCAVPNETASSQSEFLGFVDFGLYDVADTADPAKTAEERFGSLPDEIGNSTSTIPVWYSAYGSAIQNNATIFPLTNETLMETDLLYNTSSNILISSANSRFSGGARYGWCVQRALNTAVPLPRKLTTVQDQRQTGLLAPAARPSHSCKLGPHSNRQRRQRTTYLSFRYPPLHLRPIQHRVLAFRRERARLRFRHPTRMQANVDRERHHSRRRWR